MLQLAAFGLKKSASNILKVKQKLRLNPSIITCKALYNFCIISKVGYSSSVHFKIKAFMFETPEILPKYFIFPMKTPAQYNLIAHSKVSEALASK